MVPKHIFQETYILKEPIDEKVSHALNILRMCKQSMTIDLLKKEPCVKKRKLDYMLELQNMLTLQGDKWCPIYVQYTRYHLRRYVTIVGLSLQLVGPFAQACFPKNSTDKA